MRNPLLPPFWLSAGIALGLLSSASLAPAQTKKPPYWASIVYDKTRMRVGPNTDYPTTWIYQRKGLPVKVVEVYATWRKVQDPGGTQGWMHVSQLTAQPTAIVVGGEAPMRQAPGEGAKILYRAEAGVVGKVSDCAKGWCAVDVGGKRGFVATRHLWGATE